MDHRHLHNAPQIPETGGDQGWNHTNQFYNPFAMGGAFGSSSLVLPGQNMTVQGGPFPSSAPISSGYSLSIHNAESAPHQPEAPFPHQPAAINYLHYPSSSSLGGQNELVHNQTMGSGSHKRKAPSVPHLSDKGSTSKLQDVGSSSNLPLPTDAWQLYPPPGYRANNLTVGVEHMPRNVRSRAGLDPVSNPVSTSKLHNVGSSSNLPLPTDAWQQCPPPGYRANNLTVGVEHMPRNVRSRAGLDPVINPARTSQPSNQPDLMGFWRQTLNSLTDEGNPGFVQPLAGHVANSGAEIPGSNFVGQYQNSLNAVNRSPNGSVGSGIFNHNSTSNRNHVPQNANFNGNPNQPIPNIRAQSSNFHPGQGTASNERLEIAAQIQPSVQRRLHSNALAAVHRSAVHGSRNPLDRHSDMRLDVDNMSYEELLVLGERIGSVGTGLSDSSISKCLTESIYCAPDQSEDDDERCVICLEEYKHMDDVGNLKCRHDFHVVCIRKWLSLKNICPICKSTALG